MSIKLKLVTAFLILAILPVGFFGVMMYESGMRERLDSTLNSLAILASQQEQRVFTQIQTARELNNAAANNLKLRTLVTEARLKPDAVNKLRQTLEEEKLTDADIREISVLDRDLRVVASTRPQTEGKEYLFAQLLTQSRDQEVIEVVPSDENTLDLLITNPVVIEGRLEAVLAMRTQTYGLQAILTNYTGLGESGETMLGKYDREGSLVNLFQLRFDEQGLLKVLPKWDESAMPAAMKKMDVTEEKIYTDYRGKQVLAVGRYIDIADWGLVVKIDWDEVGKPMRQYVQALALYMALLVPGATILSVLISKSLADPLVRMSQMAKKISQGEMEVRMPEKGNDEVGQLARTFNEMAVKLGESHQALEMKVLERTKELDKKILELEHVNKLMVDREMKMIEMKRKLGDKS